jgi:hypothetical protein
VGRVPLFSWVNEACGNIIDYGNESLEIDPRTFFLLNRIYKTNKLLSAK